MDGSRTIGGLRRFAVLFLTAAIMAGGLIGVGATSSSAADPVATPYIFAPPSTVVGEASGSVTLPVTLSAPGTSTVTVNYSVPGGGCNNLNQGSSGTLTFTPGVVSRNVTVTINNCNVKGKAFFTLTLSSAVNGIIAQATTQVDIVGDNNLQATPGLYVKDAVADTSAGTVQVPVLLGGPGGATSASTVTVHYTTANGSAVAGTDYTLTSGNLTFAPGQTVATVTVPIVNRVSPATARSFSVVLSSPTNAAIIGGTGVVTIGASGGSNVATPFVFAPPNTVVGEADGWVDLPVTLSAPSASLVTVAYAVPGGGCNNLNQGSSGTVSFTPGVVLKVVRVQINDCQVAGKSFFTLTLSSAVNGIIAQATTQVDVVGDNNLQATPGLYVKDAVADTSAGTVQVPVLLGGPGGATSAGTVTVHFTTANGSAVAGTDYTSTSGTLTFGPGQTVATVTVPIIKRVSSAVARSFSVVLSAPTNAAIIGGTGVVTVGASGGSTAVTPFVFAPPNTVVGEADGYIDLPVTLSAPSASLVTVAFTVPGGGCNNFNQGSSGTASFTPGVVLKVVRVQINDCQVAGKSFFTLTLSGATNATIAQATTQVDVVGDNNLQATPGLYVKDAVADTSAGTVQVPVLLGGPGGATSAGTVTVHFTTANGSAVAGTDYTSTSGTLTFGPGQTVATVIVPIVNRATAAGVRSFSVSLFTPTNAAIVSGVGTVTIGASGGSNVATPAISAPAAQTTTQDDGWIDLRVSLSAPSANLVTVHYAVPGGGCNNLNQGSSGTLSFVPRVVTQIVRVQINNCGLATGGPFTLTLSAATNATIATATTVVTFPPVSYTTKYTAAEQPRVLQSAAFMGVTPEELQRNGIFVIIYILNTTQPRPTATLIAPPTSTGPVSYTTTWTSADIGFLRVVQAQYFLTPEQAQKWGVQVLNYLLVAGGH